jgi:ribonuclease D
MPRPKFPAPRLITGTAELAALCDKLRAEPFIAVDTEFMRERTYWPILCIVQLAGIEDVAIVDAEAPDLDLAPLGALLADANVVKVFHAARQDIEIFVQRFGAVPASLFDTQIAAMVAGYGDQVGYDQLVSSITGQSIEKAHRFSDWSARPLSAAQLTYAAADVTYLRIIYEKLRQRLQKDGREEWVREEITILNDIATYRPDPAQAWERLRPRSSNRRYLGAVRQLATWREIEAQRHDIPRQRLIRDETLLEVAAMLPRDAEALARARGLTKGFAEGKTGAGLLEAVAAAKAIPEDDLPEATAARVGPKPSPGLVSLLKVLLAAACETHHVAPKLVANSEDIDRLASEDEPDIAALHGWRRRVFGEDAQRLKAGKVALTTDGRRVKLLAVDATS